MGLSNRQKIGGAALLTATCIYLYNKNQSNQALLSNSNATIGQRITDIYRLKTYLPDKFEDDVIYAHIRLSDHYSEKGAKSAISWVVSNIIIPKYGYAIKFGRSGNPEKNKKGSYYPKESIMIPLYASRDREQIKRFEKYFINKFKYFCNIYDCLVGNKDDKDRGRPMTARNGNWFFLYIVVYRNNSHLNSRSFHCS